MFLEFLQVDQPHRAREEGFWRTHVGERLTTADLIPPLVVPYGSSSSFVLPLGFRVRHIMVAGAGPGVRLVGTGGLAATALRQCLIASGWDTMALMMRILVRFYRTRRQAGFAGS